MIITIEDLTEEAPRCEGVDTFRRLFGHSAEVTKENIARAQAAGLDIAWAVRQLMSRNARSLYYKEQGAAARAYAEATVSERQAYDDATTAATSAYNEATAPAQRAYDQAIISAFLRAAEIHDQEVRCLTSSRSS